MDIKIGVLFKDLESFCVRVFGGLYHFDDEMKGDEFVKLYGACGTVEIKEVLEFVYDEISMEEDYDVIEREKELIDEINNEAYVSIIVTCKSEHDMVEGVISIKAEIPEEVKELIRLDE